MKKSIARLLFVVFIVVFILLQMFVRFNTSLLVRDLDDSIFCYSKYLSKPQYVNYLIEISKKYGEYKSGYEYSIYYILGAIILLILFIFSTKNENGKEGNKINSQINQAHPESDAQS
jgi:uncharacterized integral membrane protein